MNIVEMAIIPDAMANEWHLEDGSRCNLFVADVVVTAKDEDEESVVVDSINSNTDICCSSSTRVGLSRRVYIASCCS
jgi:hypothetical protein